MSRISIELPQLFPFSTLIPIRITDLNYGGHVGNDTILSLIHEARVQFLRHYGYSEMDFAGAGMIMSDAAVSFKNELFYGEEVRIYVSVTSLSRASFDLVYRLEKYSGEKSIPVAEAKTGMVCYDYKKKKITAVPEDVKEKWKDLI